MTEHEILNSVSNYFLNHQYQTKRIDAGTLPQGKKAPDYEVFYNGCIDFYCEVKSPLLLVNDLTKMFHWSTSVSKLRKFIHKAVEQLKDSDPNHIQPWVVVFTSDHFQLNWANMVHAITGVIAYGNSIIRDLRTERYVVDTENDLKMIDLFVWFQMNKTGEIYQVRFFINKDSIHAEECEIIANKLEPCSTDKACNR